MNSPQKSPVAHAVSALGSLRLTVTLLGMSIFLVFAGTLAQRHMGIWTVMEQYFRCWFAWVDIRSFCPDDWHVPRAFQWGEKGRIPFGFPFPGGRLLGSVLLVNLLVSHASRIRLVARGPRLLIGLATLAVGLLATWVVISHVFDLDSTQKVSNPSLRVTYQLIYGGGAGAILYVACWLLFQRKAGIVLLHAGVVILMLSELATSLLAKEGQMSIFEGQSVNFVEDTRTVELAIIDSSNSRDDDVYVVPKSKLEKSGTVKIDGVPFEIETNGTTFMKNGSLEPIQSGDVNPATRGAGLRWKAVDRPESSGVDTSGSVDLPAAYIKLKGPGGEDYGTWLVSIPLTMEKGAQIVNVGGKEYRLLLRFERTYKPYSLYLYSFRFDRYAGTDTPKDYSSFIRLEDAERDVSRDVRIWMNNPLRYRGDTLYQSSFDAATEKGTVLQVVENRGWMAPYVGCMIVAIGLLGQFQLHLMQFLRKRASA
ncbi:MAG TPA: cytochrome c biogenesis protein ResB [Planctomycetota bacterium]|nr:cytochrome c biogenesis protein ResB [Planctomycetota bacterium]